MSGQLDGTSRRYIYINIIIYSFSYSLGHWVNWIELHLLDFVSIPNNVFALRVNNQRGFIICIATGSVYLEFTAYFPSRSGAEVVFLEQAYPRPAWFFPTTFAIQNVVFSFSSSNAIGEISIQQPQSAHAYTPASFGKLYFQMCWHNWHGLASEGRCPRRIYDCNIV